jgi:hypothetical protein
MRKIFAFIFTFIAKSIATIFAALFIVTALLSFLLLNFEHTLFDTETYKRALLENEIYEQFPVLFSKQIAQVATFIADPCAASPLGCSIDSASPELQACLMGILGEDAYVKIGSGQRTATEAEVEASQPCLDQFGQTASQSESGNAPPDENPLINASAEVQSCIKQTLGDEAFATLYDAERGPTDAEIQQISACFEQAGETPQSNTPGVVGPMTFLNNFSPEQWQTLMTYLLPPDDLQNMTEATLDQVFAYLNGEADTASIPLTGLKARLTGQAGEELILFLLNAQPACTEEQQAQITAGVFGEKGKTPILCAASGETLDMLLPELQRQMNEAVSGIPDEAIIIQPPSASDPSSPLGANPKAALRLLHVMIRLSPLVPLIFLLLVTLFGVRSLKGWLRWWGIPILIVGLITLSIGIAAMPLLQWAWVNYAVDRIPPLISPSLGELVHGLANSLVRDLAKGITISASLIVLLGLAAIVGSFFVKSKPKKAALPATPIESPPGDISSA